MAFELENTPLEKQSVTLHHLINIIKGEKNRIERIENFNTREKS